MGRSAMSVARNLSCGQSDIRHFWISVLYPTLVAAGLFTSEGPLDGAACEVWETTGAVRRVEGGAYIPPGGNEID